MRSCACDVHAKRNRRWQRQPVSSGWKPYPGSPFTGGGLPGPWAATIDGNDNVWISNFAMKDSPIMELCGARTENCPPGFKTGDQISPPGGYVGGGLQMQTDLAISPAGDVWVMDNWQDIDSCYPGAPEATSTRCGGQGVTVFFGMAKPSCAANRARPRILMWPGSVCRRAWARCDGRRNRNAPKATGD